MILETLLAYMEQKFIDTIETAIIGACQKRLVVAQDYGDNKPAFIGTNTANVWRYA